MGLRPRFTTPLSRARDAFARYLLRPFEIFQPRTRFLVGFAFLVIVTTLLLISGYSSGFSEDYEEGDIVRRTVVAPADITTTDILETEKRRAAARESTRPVFNFDSTRGASSAQSFRAAWEGLKHQVGSKTAGNKQPTWSGEGGAAVAHAIIAHGFDDAKLERLTTLIREIGDGYIYDDGGSDRLRQEIVLVDVRNPAAQMIVPSPRTRMTPLTATRRDLELLVLNLRGWSQGEKTALVQAMVPLIRPNVVLDQTATASARESEANEVPQILISLKRNQV
ncbi:MAG: hypothetical protein H0W34_06805, partial [Pyrinomonadaceae bacterium]|nr:hypothetical protein [Pyrinomonadaceae bacterium]